MPRSPVFVARQFGELLKELRGDASFGEYAQRLRPHVEDTGIKLSRSNIEAWEKGRPPNWLVLRAYSRTSGRPFMELVVALVSSIKTADGRDLLGHSGDPGSGLTKGAPHAPESSSSSRRLEAAAKVSAALADQVQHALVSLTHVEADLRKQARTLAPDGPGRRGRDRKTG